MSFSVNYELFHGDVNVAPSGSVDDDSCAYVVIYTSKSFLLKVVTVRRLAWEQGFPRRRT